MQRFHPDRRQNLAPANSNLLAWLGSFWMGLVLLVAAGPAAARGAELPLEVSELRIGLDHSFRLGAWTAIEFDLAGPGGTEVTPVVRAVDPDGRATFQPLTPVVLEADRPVHVRGLFCSGKLNASLQLQLKAGDRILKTVPVRVNANASTRSPGAVLSLRQSTSVWLAIGNQPVFVRGLEQWNAIVPDSAYLITLEEIGERIWSDAVLDGVDVLVFNGNTALNPESSAAIRSWVRQGGRLIVAIGSTWEEFNRGPMAEWSPLKPDGQIDVAKLTGLQDLVPRSSQLRTLTTLPGARLNRAQGVVVAPGLSGPLAMRSAYGSGQVTMLAVSLDQAPLATWEADSQARLTGVLSAMPLPWDVTTGARQVAAETDFDPSAVTDLQSQLMQTLDHFQGVTPAAPWTVIGWIALFAMVIGPLDYLIVRHWLQRPEWTWGTMVLWVLLGSGLAIARGNALNEHPAVSRQLDCVDFDLTTDTICGQSWFGFYSDQNQRQRVTAALDPAFLPEDTRWMRLKWVNRPGEGFRGMSGSGGLDETQAPYWLFADHQGIQDFPTRQWSTGAVTCRWEAAVPAAPYVEANLQELGVNRMTGTITHHLPGELTDWFLAYGNFAYFERPPANEQAAPFLPGTEWNVGQAGSNLLRGRLIGLMQAQLTGRPTSAADDQLQRNQYDVNSTDPLITEIVTSFYTVLGGETYTGLKNESLQRLDLSETISLKRAVLFGRLKLPPMQFGLDGRQLPQQQHSLMVRILLPVEQATRDPDAPPPVEILQPPK